MSGLRGARVLVTGATGFIGSRLAARLRAAGADVHVAARASSSGAKLGALWESLPRHVADLSDAASLAAAVRAADPEYVFHLAKEREGSTFQKEAAATLRLAAALKADAPRLRRWVRTAHAVREDTGRGADAELCRAIACRFALPVVTLELFQVYGPGQPEDHFPLSLLRDPKEFLSRDRNSGEDGAKDFVFVDDVCEAYELAASAPGAEGKRFEIGSGALTPRADVERLALKALGLLAPKKTPNAAAGGGEPADVRVARERLGWSARTSLAAGLAKMVESLNGSHGAVVD